MVRQRLRIGSSPLALLGRIVLLLFALALVWYGAMLVLLAFKVSPHTVNQLSGYRSAYNYLAGLEPQDITDDTRLIAGLAGLAGFLVFGYLALKQVPRPHLTRSELQLIDDEHDVGPAREELRPEVARLEGAEVEERLEQPELAGRDSLRAD